MNKFNIYPDSILLVDRVVTRNRRISWELGSWTDRLSLLCLGEPDGNLSSMASEQQSQAIMDLIDQRWHDLVGYTMKICFPALEGRDWQVVTRSQKNIPWSYHNGGNWPVLIWMLAAAAQKTGRTELVHRALALFSNCLHQDEWPEYYDGKNGRLIGKEARKYQTWTIAAFPGQ